MTKAIDTKMKHWKTVLYKDAGALSENKKFKMSQTMIHCNEKNLSESDIQI